MKKQSESSKPKGKRWLKAESSKLKGREKTFEL